MSANDGIRADWVNKDFYKVLGVSKDTDEKEIKKAYRKLARENHPDSNPGDQAKAEKFKAVAEAYDVVGDADKRKKYDEVRAMGGGVRGGFGGGGFGGGGEGFDLSDLFGQRGGAGGGFGDLFGDVFSGGGGGARGRTRAARATKGPDLETTTTLSFADSLSGTTIQLGLTSEAACGTCSGTGGKPGTKPHVCTRCEGAGYVTVQAGGFSMNETCPVCQGRQLAYDQTCPTCHGSGRAPSTRTVQARIPAGVKDGQKIRLKGKGGAGENGGPAGDLIVAIKVRPHAVFARKGDNLTVDVPVAFDEAALGAEIRVPTHGGPPVTLKVPAGTPSGRTFRVRGKGVQKKDGTRGDLLATVLVQVPSTLDEGARAAVEAYRTARAGTDPRAQLFKEE